MKQILVFQAALVMLMWGCRQDTTSDQRCGIVQQGEEVRYSGPLPNEVRAHLLSDPSSLHPTNSREATRGTVLDLCFQALLTLDISTRQLSPQLAASLPESSADGLEQYFTLHERAAWPDGAPVTAQDVLTTIKAIMAPGADNAHLRGYFDRLQDVRPDPADPRRFTFVLAEYSVQNAFTGAGTYILDRRVYDPQGILDRYTLAQLRDPSSPAARDPDLRAWADTFNSARFVRDPATLGSGSGPYRFTAWNPGQEITLTRQETYWGRSLVAPWHSQYPDKITFQIVKDEQAILLKFQQQELDVSTVLSTQLYTQLDSLADVKSCYTLANRRRDSFVSLALNVHPDGITHKPLFDDRQVRQAIAYALPLDSILRDILPGNAFRASSPVSPGHPDHHKDLKPYPYDPAKARQLLAAAGWQDTDGDQVLDKVVDGKKISFECSFYYPPNAQAVTDFVQVIRDELATFGIRCTLVPESTGNYTKQMRAHRFDMALLSLGSPAIPYEFKQLFHSTSWPEGDNFFGYQNPALDSLIDKARVASQPAARLSLVRSIQETLLEDLPVVFLYYPTKKIILHRRFNHGTIYETGEYVQLNNLRLVRSQ
ncbi:MAG: ABC transporter substrate-binding protein [Bacteroidia bacterium]|nr:ABC transporter substrate-binding protein [Bacteroidia bacterium]